ncbi:MAG: integration host factor subunit beta [Candidatus Marinimicrobia bacterium]|jgi:nucleoid DNA-binding protein|nr:integration host factor subunit beta [Candidatus Neomarinimicrobiota bacterium]MDD4961638.1 integration host factor subunit beta [Candidatus Neomarinimicrobiota bacterium]MDD5709815.1 integration host factor subunit beta [Candidatus Neomarinimicrobiota bacterium]MDX9778210.1 HU family DNA-binding protein [bacterium]
MEKKTLTKKDVAKHVRANSGLRIYETEKYMDEIFQAMTELLMDDSAERVRIEIRNFGVFEVKNAKAKPQARNPKTNEIIYVPPRKKIHFKAGKILKDFLSRARV